MNQQSSQLVKQDTEDVDSMINEYTTQEIHKLGKKILHYPPDKRSKFDIEVLHRMMCNNKFFVTAREKYGTEIYQKLLAHIYYEYCPEGDILFEFGSIGNEFFIILDGNVDIFIKLKGEQDVVKMRNFMKLDTEQIPVPEQEREKSKYAGIPKSPPLINSKVVRKGGQYYVLFGGITLFQKINTIGPGASFGDLAVLEDKPTPRMATIFCPKNCVFAVLDKKNYQKIIGEYEKKENLEKIQFLQSLSIFKGFEKIMLHSIIYFIKKQSYTLNEYIIREGQHLPMILIVKSGVIKLIKTIELEVNVKDPEEDKLVNIKKKNKSKLAIRKLEISILSKNEVLGEEYLYFDRPLEYDVISCSTTTECWAMDIEHFTQRYKQVPGSEAHLKKICIHKREMHNEKAQIQIKRMNAQLKTEEALQKQKIARLEINHKIREQSKKNSMRVESNFDQYHNHNKQRFNKEFQKRKQMNQNGFQGTSFNNEASYFIPGEQSIDNLDQNGLQNIQLSPLKTRKVLPDSINQTLNFDSNSIQQTTHRQARTNRANTSLSINPVQQSVDSHSLKVQGGQKQKSRSTLPARQVQSSKNEQNKDYKYTRPILKPEMSLVNSLDPNHDQRQLLFKKPNIYELNQADLTKDEQKLAALVVDQMINSLPRSQESTIIPTLFKNKFIQAELFEIEQKKKNRCELITVEDITKAFDQKQPPLFYKNLQKMVDMWKIPTRNVQKRSKVLHDKKDLTNIKKYVNKQELDYALQQQKEQLEKTTKLENTTQQAHNASKAKKVQLANNPQIKEANNTQKMKDFIDIDSTTAFSSIKNSFNETITGHQIKIQKEQLINQDQQNQFKEHLRVEKQDALTRFKVKDSATNLKDAILKQAMHQVNTRSQSAVGPQSNSESVVLTGNLKTNQNNKMIQESIQNKRKMLRQIQSSSIEQQKFDLNQNYRAIYQQQVELVKQKKEQDHIDSLKQLNNQKPFTDDKVKSNQRALKMFQNMNTKKPVKGQRPNSQRFNIAENNARRLRNLHFKKVDQYNLIDQVNQSLQDYNLTKTKNKLNNYNQTGMGNQTAIQDSSLHQTDDSYQAEPAYKSCDYNSSQFANQDFNLGQQQQMIQKRLRKQKQDQKFRTGKRKSQLNQVYASYSLDQVSKSISLKDEISKLLTQRNLKERQKEIDHEKSVISQKIKPQKAYSRQDESMIVIDKSEDMYIREKDLLISESMDLLQGYYQRGGYGSQELTDQVVDNIEDTGKEYKFNIKDFVAQEQTEIMEERSSRQRKLIPALQRRLDENRQQLVPGLNPHINLKLIPQSIEQRVKNMNPLLRNRILEKKKKINQTLQ